MKIILLVLTTVLTTSKSFSQMDSLFVKEYQSKLYHTGKVYKTVGFALLTASAATMITGIVVSNNTKGPQIVGPGVGIFMLGALGSIGSIPLFIMSHRYKQQAVRFQLGHTRVSMHSMEENMGVGQPTISLKIPLL